MTRTKGIVCAALVALLGVMSGVREAEACGGCFVPPVTQSRTATQVTGHRMLLSLGPQQTTLYDQIEYAGAPESFAWVLPIKGIAEVGLSSDLLFNVLDEISAVTITSPTINCPPVQPCWSGNSTSSGFGTTGGSG